MRDTGLLRQTPGRGKTSSVMNSSNVILSNTAIPQRRVRRFTKQLVLFAATPEFDASHLGLATSETDCLSCHTPHASEGLGLIWPNRHPPFTEGNCDDCHDDLPR